MPVKEYSLSYMPLGGDATRVPQQPPLTPLQAAQDALAALPAPIVEETIGYQSEGRLIIVGAADRALPMADDLAPLLNVTVLLPPEEAVRVPTVREYDIACGNNVSVSGYLGNFALSWQGWLGDSARLDGKPMSQEATFDLVLDLSLQPLLNWRQPPQGYFHLAESAQPGLVLARLVHLVGEFEKPKYFNYRADKCAHERSQITGCSQCITICSTQAITAEGDSVRINPHLCMGCGACATTCPSGALGYQLPTPGDFVGRIRHALEAFTAAGGTVPRLLVHQGLMGRRLVNQLLGSMPAATQQLLPLEVHHLAAAGIDVWLSSIAFGAAEIILLANDELDAAYSTLLQREVRLANTILAGLGYPDHRVRLVEGDNLASLLAEVTDAPPQPFWQKATFQPFDDKRTALDLAIAHLLAHSPQPPEAFALPAAAPYGQVLVNADACTLCMSCVGACPTSALATGGDLPQLRFAEHNCVQCGLCVATCPEDALALDPRLLLTPEARRYRTINEATPFHCTRCGTAIGTTRMVDKMLQKLSLHPMFSGPGALDRLKMCSDCRVIDMMENGNAPTIK